jgi:tryptophanyl-tRNA synthetase
MAEQHMCLCDDEQRLELTRDLAEVFNRLYPSPPPMFQRLELMLSAFGHPMSWPPPNPSFEVPSERILSLRDPTVKMSKLIIDPNLRILLIDVELPGTSPLLTRFVIKFVLERRPTH